jgi:hypothetical protein
MRLVLLALASVVCRVRALGGLHALRRRTTGLRAHDRRAFLSAAALASATVPAAALAAEDAPMVTSADLNSYRDVTGQGSTPMGVGTMASRSRPVTGVVLADERNPAGQSKDGTVEVELASKADGRILVLFDAPTLGLAPGMFRDVEARNGAGESAYLTVLGSGGAAAARIPTASITGGIFATQSRWGAYGAPTDIKVTSRTTGANGVELIDVAFSTLSPGGTEVPRKATIAAVAPAGTDQLVVLTASSTASRFRKKDVGAALTACAGSLRATFVPSTLRKGKR